MTYRIESIIPALRSCFADDPDHADALIIEHAERYLLDDPMTDPRIRRILNDFAPSDSDIDALAAIIDDD